jgi:uncharacterized delta-60 repeat protein
LWLGHASTVLAGPGQLDPTFGNGGKITLGFGGTVARATAVAVQPDGRIVVVGRAQTSSTPASADFAVVRFTPDGTLDPTFGAGGKVNTDFFGNEDGANAVALQPDGKIVVGGYAIRASGGMTFALARYGANGQLDAAFGTGGKVVTSSAPNPYPWNSLDPCKPLGSTALVGLYEITAVAVQADGRIVVGGNAMDITVGNRFYVDIALVRYQSNGDLDPSLLPNGPCPGINGIRIDNLSGVAARDYLTSLLVLPNGNIVAGGSTEYFQSGQSHEVDSFLLRYQPDGAPDPTFGNNSSCPDRTCAGVVTVDTHPIYGWVDAIAALALQSDGKIVSAGRTLWTFYPQGEYSIAFALTRHASQGAPDGSFGFGSNGVVSALLPQSAPPYSMGYGGTAIAVDPSGRTIVAGGTSSDEGVPGARDFALARFSTGGSLDGVFNGSGFATTDFFGLEDAALGVAVQADGRIVVVGFAHTTGTTSQMAIARYEGGGTCTYSAKLWYTQYPAATTGYGYADVTTPAGCPWTAASNSPWIHMAMTSGSGPRTFAQMFTIDPNAVAARIGKVTIAGIALTVTQAGTTAVPPEDLVIDFGPGYGIWLLSGSGWSQPHGDNPEAMIRADLDGNLVDDLIVDFGSPLGVWSWMNRSAWIQLHGLSPIQMAAGDLDGNGRDEALFSFKDAGTWIWCNNASWSQLHALNPTSIVTADLDDSGRDEVILDFPGAGVWIYGHTASWRLLHPFGATAIVAADLDNNTRDDLVIHFSGSGVWTYSNDSTWSLLHPANPARVSAGDLDANGLADLVIDFGSMYGLWVLRNSSAWTPLHPFTSRGILMVDRDGDRRDEVIIDFGSPYGIWQHGNSVWTQLHGFSAEGLLEGRFH